ncbi:MAG: MEDS domain-containing protein [Rhodospirillaceae bacterium]
MTHQVHFTKSGLTGIELVPFGMHACHFYDDRDELLSTLIPYFLAGLRARERCIWITLPPLTMEQAFAALRVQWGGVDDAMNSGAITILDAEGWNDYSAGVKGADLVQFWLAEEECALADGYEGLRITANTGLRAETDGPALKAYQEGMTASFAGRRIVALCSYPRSARDHAGTLQITGAHHCTLERCDRTWQVVDRDPQFPKS